jgi:signal transduction histidine kinase
VSRLVLDAGSEVEPDRRPELGGDTAADRASPVPGLLVAASTVVTAVGIVLYLQNRGAAGTSPFFDPVAPAVALTAPAVGAVLAQRRPSDPSGWLLCAGGLVGLAFFAEQYALFALVVHPGLLPAGTWMAWLGSWVWIPGLVPLTTVLLLVFPDGRLPSPRWRPVPWAVAALVTLAVVSTAMTPDNAGSPAPVNPAGITALPQLSALIQTTTGICILVLGPLCLGGLAVRFCRTPTTRRSQLRWFLAAAVMAVGAPLVGVFLPLGVYQALGLLGLVGLSVGIIVGAIRYRLYEIDRRDLDLLTSRAMVYASLVLLAIAIYWIAVNLADVGFGVRGGLGPSGISALAVAAAWRPARSVISDAVERLRSPRRAYHALISLGQCLESNMIPDDVLPALAETIAAALELGYVAVEVGRDEEVTAAAVHGEPRQDVTVVPLVHHHEVVGRLSVAPAPGEHLHPADLRLLRDLASQAGAAAYSVRVTADLRLSRERLVTAREEEWRHVRRELHDRLGPLDGTLLGIGAAANTLERGDTTGTMVLLARVKTDLRSEIADIRSLVERLRPKSLDELGLVGALQRHAALSALPPQPLLVIVEAEHLAGLPAAVEVAAYQIVSEALTNVRRHARARRCNIRLAVNEGWLEVEVVDDGIGLPAGFREGVGLSGMRERATEIGGSFGVDPGPGHGTRVCVELPVCAR